MKGWKEGRKIGCKRRRRRRRIDDKKEKKCSKGSELR